jgi:hypothetical protein
MLMIAQCVKFLPNHVQKTSYQMTVRMVLPTAQVASYDFKGGFFGKR